MPNNLVQPMNQLYLSFSLGERRFLTDINVIREVRQMKGFTEVPQSSPELLGIVNLRGDVIPVFDLRSILGTVEQATTNDSSLCLIIDVDQRICALVVQSVADVVNLEAEKILPLPGASTNQSAAFYKGIVQIGSEYSIVLDLHAILQLLQPQEHLLAEL